MPTRRDCEIIKPNYSLVTWLEYVFEFIFEVVFPGFPFEVQVWRFGAFCAQKIFINVIPEVIRVNVNLVEGENFCQNLSRMR